MYLNFSVEVADALDRGLPVVALESTIIAHGMPWPGNVETALRVEAAVREEGATPATIALLDGSFRVGLNEAELAGIGRIGQGVAKASLRDLPWLLLKKLPGATTVAATLRIAHQAGISIFATGGIGGVHRGAAETFDISADLPELALSNVAVVCAGAKSILDIGLTLEYLETAGVPVVGVSTDEFPAFYTRHSGYGVDCRLDSPTEIAGFLRTKWAAGLPGGVVVANPIPAAHEPAFGEIQAATEEALREAAEKELRGKAITPYLLRRIAELTEGRSLRANEKLVIHNARVAARTAVALAKKILKE